MHRDQGLNEILETKTCHFKVKIAANFGVVAADIWPRRARPVPTGLILGPDLSSISGLCDHAGLPIRL